MDRCANCGATERLLHQGTRNSYTVFGKGLPDLYESTAYQRIECAQCGAEIWAQRGALPDVVGVGPRLFRAAPGKSLLN